MKIMQGDLLKLGAQGAFDVILHGANCQCVMGAGIARGIRFRFPEAYDADQATRKLDPGAKLGDISWARSGELRVVNAYTQLDYRGPLPRVDYEAVRSCMRRVKAEFSGLRIGYPRIGAGLAGGDWEVIAAIIDEELDGEAHTLVEYVP